MKTEAKHRVSHSFIFIWSTILAATVGVLLSVVMFSNNPLHVMDGMHSLGISNLHLFTAWVSCSTHVCVCVYWKAIQMVEFKWILQPFFRNTSNPRQRWLKLLVCCQTKHLETHARLHDGTCLHTWNHEGSLPKTSIQYVHTAAPPHTSNVAKFPKTCITDRLCDDPACRRACIT